MNNKHEIILPFQGFYYSIHDQNLDQQIDYFTECDKLKERCFDCIEWRKVRQEYSKAYTHALSNLLDIELEFKGLLSPKFYNYQTDRILASIESDTVLKLFAEVDQQMLAKRIKDQFTAHDGYIPHYDNELNEWLKKPVLEWDHNELSTLLCAWIDSKTDYLADEIDWNVLDRMDDLPLQIMFNAIPERIHSIANYLNMRANR